MSSYVENLKVTIENLKKIEISLEKEKLQRELQISHTIQNKLLPSNITSHSKVEISTIFLPAEEVGSDFMILYLLVRISYAYWLLTFQEKE